MVGIAGALLLGMLTVAPLQEPAQESMDTVRQLYVSADYESALTVLERLAAANASGELTEIERYRALCLIALGRSTEAEIVIERIVRANPWYQPDEQEAPRVRSTFAAVRARVLPFVVRALYTEAKAAFDRKDHKAAVPGFERTLAVLDALESADPSLADLRTIATGFLDLSRAALVPPSPPEPPPIPVVATPPVSTSAMEPIEPPTDPVIIDQTLPHWNPATYGVQGRFEFRGAVEVTIDPTGAVIAARVAEPTHPAYDVLLLEAALRWRYEPARRRGKPVESTKLVEVVLRPDE